MSLPGPSSSGPNDGTPSQPLPQNDRSDRAPLRKLWETLTHQHVRNNAEFSLRARSTVVQDLYTAIGIKSYPHLYMCNGDDPPLYAIVDQDGLERNWALRDRQLDILHKVGLERAKSPGMRCDKTLPKGAKTYSCRTCQADALSVLCTNCFNASDHEGHEVLFGTAIGFSTVCDCNDPSAWRPESLGCEHHPPLQPGQTLIDHAIEYTSLTPGLTRALTTNLYETICVTLEAIINSFSHSLLPNEYGDLPANLNDMLTHIHQTAEPKDRRSHGRWSVTVITDEKHTGPEVERQMQVALGCTPEVAATMRRKLDLMGRLVLVTTHNPFKAFHAASSMRLIDLTVSLRKSNDVCKEDMGAALIQWLRHMCETTIGGDIELFRRLLLRALLEPRLPMLAVTSGSEGTPFPSDLQDLELERPFPIRGQKVTRLDWLFYLDVRLWRESRLDLRSIYTHLCTLGETARNSFACRFSINYPRLFEYFIYYDRDIEAMLIHSLAGQLFPDPVASLYATERAQLFNIVVDTAYAWYTLQMVEDRLRVPALRPGDLHPEAEAMVRINPDRNHAFRSKKGAVIMQHIRRLLKNERLQRLVVRVPSLFDRFLTLANIFVAMQSQAREMGEHVEFEVDWPKAFVVLGEMSRACRDFGSSFQFANSDQMLTALSRVLTKILHDQNMVTEILDPEKYYPPALHIVSNVLLEGVKCKLIQTDVMTIKAFSFHHYLHLLFAELLRWAPAVAHFQDEEGQDLSFDDFVDAMLFRSDLGDPTIDKLTLLEVPLTKFAVFAHVKADMWRKNGVAMRSQVTHYRDIAFREATLDQDFFLLQFGLCTLRPVMFMTALIDKFELTNLFRGDATKASNWISEACHPRQYAAILEELVLLVISLFCDTRIIRNVTRDEITRCHLIHLLALNSMTFSELCKKLPEKSLDKSITPILQDIADLRAPTETATGVYVLKPEFYSEVDPYWRHYTRNEHRTVQNRLIQEAKRLHPEVENPLILPPPLKIPPKGSAFSNLYEGFYDQTMPAFIGYLLTHCLMFGENPQLESITDLALHLTMVALAISPQCFAGWSLRVGGDNPRFSVFQRLWLMQTNETFKAFRPKIDYILNTIVTQLPDDMTQDYRRQREVSKQVIPAPAVKTNAAERQKALMAEFAQRQTQFAANLLDDDDDLTEEMEDEEIVTYGQCIVCQEQVSSKQPGGMLALLQPSRILRDVVNDRVHNNDSSHPSKSSSEPIRGADDTLLPQDPVPFQAHPSTGLRFGVHMSACGHMMHDICMTTYFDATRHRHSTQVQRHHPENAMRQEYLCPLCKSIGNVLIPVEPTKSSTLPLIQPSKSNPGFPVTLNEKIRLVCEESLLRVRDSGKIWDYHIETGELAPWFTDCVFYHSTLDLENRRAMRNSAKMIDKFRALARALSEQSQRLRGRKSHMYVPEDIVSYTVACVEVTQRGYPLRGDMKSVAEQVPETTTKLIKHLIGMLQLELDVFFGMKYDRASLPPDLLHSVILMSYYAELTRVMLGVSVHVRRCLGRSTSTPIPSPTDPNLEDALEIFADFRPIMYAVLRNAGPFPDTELVLTHLSDEWLSKLLYSYTISFLRRCSIIFYSVSGTYPSLQLIETKGKSEYRQLLELLVIPSPKETLANPRSTESPIVARWINQWALQGRTVPPLEYPGKYELFKLPRLLEEMVMRYFEMRCTNCGIKPTWPAVCLFCGTFLCLGGDCCSEGEQGECNIHMRDCGAAVGMFVDIKRWHILYLYAGSGSFGPMPYLDQHGELDVHMRRGQRQYLHLGRLDELRRAVWLQHTIPHLTARKLELTSDAGGWSCL
ncbi:hypothetical protein TREMEDRAFT_33731 [Tremella mesenterica DSM 1558]|uniref:uncharacterized protein n=1 Tax=Tremella mesenterica (strain ATCC 24925 / CBS 8224 / DSM 1558 / NBRC 9311 / NRRL Y-6157 / RJB 2259-6 / UBC 559-6) TaxID=578456 RepID=UPI0003F49D78|nr:uncharacterized protein TREMEDRAFT_33731 [Tremella mesenterica DSM 1558]EIW67293.1 hypothetical protein TREMEDRAFT_33731 [Tremella mesenterica DSM 1558]